MTKRTSSIVRSTVSLLLALIVTLSFTGCAIAERSAIKKDVVVPFEKACHEKDVKGILRCFDPSISDPILTAVGFADLLGITDYLDRFIGLIDNFTKIDTTVDAFMESISVKPKEYSFNDTNDKCVVTADVSYHSGEETKTITATLRCVRIDGKWYLSRIGF